MTEIEAERGERGEREREREKRERFEKHTLSLSVYDSLTGRKKALDSGHVAREDGSEQRAGRHRAWRKG